MVRPWAGVRYWCQDETRLGLKTIQRRKITAKGVKPIGQLQWERKAFYLYGVVAPRSGESFFWEFSHLDSACFEAFLQLLSQQYPKSLNILQVDRCTAHRAKQLHIPENIILLFQPAQCPELNPIERLWQSLKDKLAWGIYEDLDQLRSQVAQVLQGFCQETIASLTGWSYILESLHVAGIY